MRGLLIGTAIVSTVAASSSAVIGQGNKTRLTLADATAIIAAAQKSAASMKVQVSVAVVDSRGDLIALERLPGASGTSVDATIGKAMVSAIVLRPSGNAGNGTNPASPWPAVNESTGGRLRFIQGGVPVVRHGVLMGAVAAGGATSEQDEMIANDGAAAIP